MGVIVKKLFLVTLLFSASVSQTSESEPDNLGVECCFSEGSSPFGSVDCSSDDSGSSYSSDSYTDDDFGDSMLHLYKEPNGVITFLPTATTQSIVIFQAQNGVWAYFATIPYATL